MGRSYIIMILAGWFSGAAWALEATELCDVAHEQISPAREASYAHWNVDSSHWMSDHPELAQKLQNYRESRKPRLIHPLKKPRKVGDEIEVNGQPYKIKEVLGAGSEADVFLVNTPQGERVVKAFRNKREAQKKSEWLQELRAKGVNTAEVYEVDPKNGTALMEHIYGVSRGELKDPSQIPNLAPAERNFLTSLYLQHLKSQPQINDISENFVLNLRDGRFYLIDPL